MRGGNPKLADEQKRRRDVGEHEPNDRKKTPFWVCPNAATTTAFWLLLLIAAGGVATVGLAKLNSADPEKRSDRSDLGLSVGSAITVASTNNIFKPATTCSSSSTVSTRTFPPRNSPTMFQTITPQGRENIKQATLAVTALKASQIEFSSINPLSETSKEYEALVKAHELTEKRLRENLSISSAEAIGLDPNESVVFQLGALFQKVRAEPAILQQLKPETAAVLYLYWKIATISQVKCAETFGYGFNPQSTAFLYNQLSSQPAIRENNIPVEPVMVIYRDSTVDKIQSFIVIGRDPNSKLSDPNTWGPNAVVINSATTDNQIFAAAKPNTFLSVFPKGSIWFEAPFAGNYKPPLHETSTEFQAWYERALNSINRTECYEDLNSPRP